MSVACHDLRNHEFIIMVDCLDVSTKWICMLTDFGNFELRTHSNISNIRGG